MGMLTTKAIFAFVEYAQAHSVAHAIGVYVGSFPDRLPPPLGQR